MEQIQEHKNLALFLVMAALIGGACISYILGRVLWTTVSWIPWACIVLAILRHNTEQVNALKGSQSTKRKKKKDTDSEKTV